MGELGAWTTLIGSLGFPIVCCIGMFWFINNTVKDLTTTITNNTTVVTRLIEKLEDKE